MKRFAQRITLLIAACTIFLTGMGVTVINCQCISCDKQTFFMSAQQTCCSPNKTETDETKSCCSSHKTCHSTEKYLNDAHCSISRLSIDIDPSSFRPHLSIPYMWVSDALFLPVLNILPDEIESSNDYIHLKTPPDISPREYLSIIRVLII